MPWSKIEETENNALYLRLPENGKKSKGWLSTQNM